MQAPQITLDRAKRLRRTMTRPEIKLWLCLRRQQLDGLKFRRQHPLGPWILDFYCDEAKLAVEVDGEGHINDARYAQDQRRTAWLADKGVRVVRFSARVVMTDMEAVLSRIKWAARASAEEFNR
ncbi:MAG: endonuclease domain-containing protein [Ignavibacteriales bacterium]